MGLVQGSQRTGTGFPVPGLNTEYPKPGNARSTQLVLYINQKMFVCVCVCLCKRYTNLDFSIDFNKIPTSNKLQISEGFSEKTRPVPSRDPGQTGIFVPSTRVKPGSRDLIELGTPNFNHIMS